MLGVGGKRKRGGGQQPDVPSPKQLCRWILDTESNAKDLVLWVRNKVMKVKETAPPCVPGFLNNDDIALAIVRGAIGRLEGDQNIFKIKSLNTSTKLCDQNIYTPHHSSEDLLSALGCVKEAEAPATQESSTEDEEDHLVCREIA